MSKPAREIHVIGAGMAGLSAALQLSLSGEKVTIHESAPYAGGRCRSYHDKGLGCRIDNGNHLVLSGNEAIRDYLFHTGATETVTTAPQADFPFMDIKTGEKWTVRLNEGRLPLWLLDSKKRIPGTQVKDYLSAFNILMADDKATVLEKINAGTNLYTRFWEPLTIAGLNTEPREASAKLLANLFSQSFGQGGKACHPLIPKIGLSESFVTPCLATLQKNGAKIRFGQRLRAIITRQIKTETNIEALDFGEKPLKLGPADWVILAVPPWVAQELIPGLLAPTEFRGILNAHFKIRAPQNAAPFTGLINSLAEWVFVRPDIVSVTISAADRYQDNDQIQWAKYIWPYCAKLLGLDPDKIPPNRILREKRATFAATPQQAHLRPPAYTGWKNLALAGDWTDTGLPSTIEGAIRSGVKAAQIPLRWE